MRQGNGQRTRVVLCLAIIAAMSMVVVGACGGDDDDATGEVEDPEVTFALGFGQNYGQAPFFSALEAGYYDDAGLEVDFVVPSGTQTAARLVGAGRADAGEFFGLDPIAAAGEAIPIRVAATWAWGRLGLMADPTGDVQSVEDLDGAQLGVFADLPYGEACRPRLLEAHGISEDSVETVDVGFDAITPLLTGRVDASEGGDPLETVTIEIEEGEAPTFLPYDEVCPPFLFGVFVNSEWAEANPETASRFIEATIEGAKLSAEDPTEARRLFVERFPDLPQPPLQFERFGEAICGPDAAEEGLGYNDREAYEDLIELSREEGLIDEDVTSDDVVTDEYLPEEPVMADTCE